MSTTEYIYKKYKHMFSLPMPSNSISHGWGKICILGSQGWTSQGRTHRKTEKTRIPNIMVARKNALRTGDMGGGANIAFNEFSYWLAMLPPASASPSLHNRWYSLFGPDNK